MLQVPRGEWDGDKTVDLPEPECDPVAAVLPAAGGNLEARACRLLEEEIIRPPEEYPHEEGLHPEWISRANDVEEELCHPLSCDAEARWKAVSVMTVDSEGEWYEWWSPKSFLDEWYVELSDYRVLVFRFWHTRA